MVRDLLNSLEENGITELVIGNLKGIRSNATYVAGTNQKIHNFWSYNIIVKRIREVAEEKGIHTSYKVSEEYTSQLCCLCSQQHRNGRIKRGLIYCETYGKCINADVNGSMNILRKVAAIPEKVSGSRLMAQPLLLRCHEMKWEPKRAINSRPMNIG